MKSSTRLAVNTAATYFRSLATVGLSLFSSRWILGALGATDYGLFSVVGSLIVFIVFLNTVMAASAARHFAYALGEGDSEGVNCWFNTSLSIHMMLPAALIIVGWPIAEYVIRHVLTIPPERVNSCIYVFRLSLVGAFASMVSVPFVAMFTAKQRLAEVALWGLLSTVCVFGLAWMLTQVTGDRRLVFAAGMVDPLGDFGFNGLCEPHLRSVSENFVERVARPWQLNGRSVNFLHGGVLLENKICLRRHLLAQHTRFFNHPSPTTFGYISDEPARWSGTLR